MGSYHMHGGGAMTSDRDHAAYDRVVYDVAQKIMYALILLLLIWVFRNIWPRFSKFLFWCGVATIVLDFLYFLCSGVVMTIIDVLKRRMSGWLWAAFIVKCVEKIFYIFALWLAAKSIEYWP